MNLKALFAHCGIVYNEVEFEEKDELSKVKKSQKWGSGRRV